MTNQFDTMGKLAFNVITTTFGYEARWQPLASPVTPIMVAIVGFGEPTEGQNLGNRGLRSMIDEYDVFHFWIEWKKGDFPGLFESVRAGNNGDEEKVTVFSDVYPVGRDFLVQEVKSIFDGRCFKAKIQPVIP